MSGEWAYECNWPTIRNDRKVIARHSQMFVSIRGRSCGVTNTSEKGETSAVLYYLRKLIMAGK